MRTHAVLAWLRRRVRDERGSASVELVIVFPVVLLIIFGAVQGGLYFYARSVALAAAQEGLSDARVEGGSSARGVQRAQEFIAEAGGDGVLPNAGVITGRDATTATITVVGTAPSVLPGIPGITVSQTATGALERVTKP